MASGKKEGESASDQHATPAPDMTAEQFWKELVPHAAAIYCASFKEDSERPDFLEMIEHKEATETEFARK